MNCQLTRAADLITFLKRCELGGRREGLDYRQITVRRPQWYQDRVVLGVMSFKNK